MKVENVEDKVKFDPDFIAIKRFDYSLTKLLERFPEGVPDHVIENAMGLTTEESELLYGDIVVKLQKVLHVKI
jgi:hypothetical protein